MSTIHFNIKFKVDFVDDNEAKKIIEKFSKLIVEKISQKIDFNEINKILYFDAQQYYIKNIDFSQLDMMSNDLTTTIEIET